MDATRATEPTKRDESWFFMARSVRGVCYKFIKPVPEKPTPLSRELNRPPLWCLVTTVDEDTLDVSIPGIIDSWLGGTRLRERAPVGGAGLGGTDRRRCRTSGRRAARQRSRDRFAPNAVARAP